MGTGARTIVVIKLANPLKLPAKGDGTLVKRPFFVASHGPSPAPLLSCSIRLLNCVFLPALTGPVSGVGLGVMSPSLLSRPYHGNGYV